VGEGGGRSRVNQIIGRYVDGLHGSNGAFVRGVDMFLHHTHVHGDSWLISDGGGNTTEQGGHFGTGWGEAENVVGEQKHC